MEQIEQLKKNNKDLKKALDKMNGKYSKATLDLAAATLDLAAAKLEIEHLTRVRDILENAETLRSQRAWTNTTVSILIGVAVGVLVMWGIGYVQ